MEKTSIEFPRLPEILTEVEEEILHLLLKNPLLNKYEVGEKLGKSYSNIYNAIKSLIAKGMVEVANVRAGKRNQNIRVECYRATERGARHVLESVQIKVNLGLISNDDDPFKNVPMDVMATLIKNYPNLFPPELQQLTERFAGILATTRMGTYTYLSIIRAKLGVEAPKDIFIEKAFQAMTESDLNVLIDLTGKLLNEEIKKLETEIQRKKLQLEFLEEIKTRSRT